MGTERFYGDGSLDVEKNEEFQHPELLPGEVFIGNSDRGGYGIDFETKRVGDKAYTIHGKPLAGYRPVFAQREEVERTDRDHEADTSSHTQPIPRFPRDVLGGDESPSIHNEY